MGFLRKHVQVSMENVIENSATLIELSCDKKLTIHKQINRQTDKQTNRQTDKQTDKQTDRQTHIHFWQTNFFSM